MFFKGLFLSLVSFIAIVGVTTLITFAEFRFSRLIRLCLPALGMLLLFIALWSRSLFLTVFLCSAALTFFYAAHRLKRVGGCRPGCHSCKPKRRLHF